MEFRTGATARKGPDRGLENRGRDLDVHGGRKEPPMKNERKQGMTQGELLMNTRSKLIPGLALGVAAIALATTAAVPARAAGDTITLGAAVSLSGKYTTAGNLTKEGYDLAINRINEMGGVKVGGKTYKLAVKYYDDESTPARGAQLAERLIQQDGRSEEHTSELQSH